MDEAFENAPMIQVCGLKKRYQLGKIGAGTLQGALKERAEQRKHPASGASSNRKKGSFYALDGIDLTVRQGETLGIIGRNGAGKSTLLKILCQITAPTEGVVDLYGRVSSMLEVGTGFHGDMTGRENIYLNGAILGMTRSEIDAKIDDIIRFSGLEEFIDTPVKRYSSGMFVKLGFSVAVNLDNEIVIMDEVLAVGDVAFQRKCIERLRESVESENKTVLYVSHNMQTVRELCNRCIVLEQGRIVFDGDTEEAIAIYMGANGVLQNKVEFGEAQRPNDELIRFHKWFSFESLELMDCAAPVFTCHDTASIALCCSVTKRLERIGFRFEVWYQDGTVIGSMLSDNFVTLDPGEHMLHVDLSFANLAPGHYRADLLAFQFDDWGGEHVLDAVYPAFDFQVESVLDDENYLIWKPNYWGSVRLSNIHISDS